MSKEVAQELSAMWDRGSNFTDLAEYAMGVERERCAEIAEDFDIMGNSPYAAADRIAKAIRTSPKQEHVCGLQGYPFDGSCPACKEPSPSRDDTGE